MHLNASHGPFDAAGNASIAEVRGVAGRWALLTSSLLGLCSGIALVYLVMPSMRSSWRPSPGTSQASMTARPAAANIAAVLPSVALPDAVSQAEPLPVNPPMPPAPADEGLPAQAKAASSVRAVATPSLRNVLPGRVAYFRCPGRILPGTKVCRRDRPLEAATWKIIAAMPSHCSDLAMPAGAWEARVHVKGATGFASSTQVEWLRASGEEVPAATRQALSACSERLFPTLKTTPQVISFRFEVR